MGNVVKIPAKVSLNKLFKNISLALGFTEHELLSYSTDVFELLEKWEEQGYVEVYEHYEDRDIGRIKRSDIGKYAIPWYLDLYHARLTKNNDPLLVIRKDNQDETGEYQFSVRFLITHDKMFGTVHDKNNDEIIKKIKQSIDELIQLGNDENQ